MKKIMFGLIVFFMLCDTWASQAVLLVSLGMPDNALKAYLQQGKQYHIPVVIRGLYTEKHDYSATPSIGSFGDTARRVKKLVHNSKVGGVSINPLLFRAFDINVVPALVVYNDDLSCIRQTAHAPYQPCAKNSFDVIVGNLPVKKLLSIVAHQSTSAARSELSKSLLNHYSREGESA